ncbi:glycosyltransferase family 2 protein [Alphaproteobacteria bacterium]|nr:glycosyltransferase family 2 protein [Alphaproteobacteria bacterium]
MPKCKLTVFIPNKNNEKYLREAIRSAENQTDANYRLIVSDNYSSDGSLGILNQCKSKNVEVIQTPKPFSYEQHLYWLISKAETDYVVFFAGDDLLNKRFVEAYNSIFQEKQNVKAVFCQYRSIDWQGVVLKRNRWPLWRRGLRNNQGNRLIRGPISNISGTAWRVKDLKKHIPIEPVGNCVDWYFSIVMAKCGPVYYCNKYLLDYRVHSESTGNSDVLRHTIMCRDMFLNHFNSDSGDPVERKVIAKKLNELNHVIERLEHI